MIYIKMPCWNPCCRRTYMGYSEWQDYRIYGCLGSRTEAIKARREFNKLLRELCMVCGIPITEEEAIESGMCYECQNN